MTSSSCLIPRLVIAAPASGVGKTTVMVGVTTALRQLGLKVATFKCGPDYLDPTYHEASSGQPCGNLDGWIMGKNAVIQAFARRSQGADIALIEGVMGLYDGVTPTQNTGSTWEIASWLEAPILLVVDAGGMARSIAALVHGFCQFGTLGDENHNTPGIVGVIANRVGSKSHTQLLGKALGPNVAFLGGLPKNPDISFAERHLGLMSLRHQTKDGVADKLKVLGSLIHAEIDLKMLQTLAAEAPLFPTIDLELSKSNPVYWTKRPHAKCRIGIARDQAFDFYYDENLEALVHAGASLKEFSPLRDDRLPDVDGLYFGGGYPEVHAAELAQNHRLLSAVRAFAASGGPVYGECGGFMYLAESITDLTGKKWPMLGLLPATIIMKDRLAALGYVEVETQEDCFLGPQGTRFRGHQFRYSEITSAPPHTIYKMRLRRADTTQTEGYKVNNVIGTYVHAHWASNPLIPHNFVEFCQFFAKTSQRVNAQAYE